MSPDLVIVGALAAVALFAIVSRTHSSFIILALCGGFVLEAFFARDLSVQIDKVLNQSRPVLLSIASIILLAIPTVLIWWHFRKSQKGFRVFQTFVPSVALALLLLVFVIDVLPPGVKNSLYDNSYLYQQAVDLSGAAVAFALSVALFDMLLLHEKHEKHSRKGRH